MSKISGSYRLSFILGTIYEGVLNDEKNMKFIWIIGGYLLCLLCDIVSKDE